MAVFLEGLLELKFDDLVTILIGKDTTWKGTPKALAELRTNVIKSILSTKDVKNKTLLNKAKILCETLGLEMDKIPEMKEMEEKVQADEIIDKVRDN